MNFELQEFSHSPKNVHLKALLYTGILPTNFVGTYVHQKTFQMPMKYVLKYLYTKITKVLPTKYAYRYLQWYHFL